MFKMIALFVFILGSICPGFSAAKEIKTLVLIIASDDKPLYKALQKVWLNYMNSDKDHFDCYFIKGREDLEVDVKIFGNTIYTKSKDQTFLPGLLDKTLISLEHFGSQLNNYDYVIRTNLSSFYYFKNLLEYLEKSPRTSFLSGIHHSNSDQSWICGAGIIMSNDLAWMLIKNKNFLLDPNTWPAFPIDDLAIGSFFDSYNITKLQGRTIEINSYWDVKNLKKLYSEKVFHIRIRTHQENRDAFEIPIHLYLLRKCYGLSKNNL